MFFSSFTKPERQIFLEFLHTNATQGISFYIPQQTEVLI